MVAALRPRHAAAGQVSTFTDGRPPATVGGQRLARVAGAQPLGSGAVINLGTLRRALGGRGIRPCDGHLGPLESHAPRERADEFVAADSVLVDRYERLTDDERTDLRVDVGFLAFPLTVAWPLGCG